MPQEKAATGVKQPPWWTLSAQQCASELGSETGQGLAGAEAAARLEQYGPNALAGGRGRTWLMILWEQLTGVMVLILIAAGVISALMGETTDAVVIAVIVVLNALLGLSQEFRAEKAMAALKEMSVPQVRVRRGGEVLEISSDELVPGDLLLLEAGNVLPADGRLLEAANLRIQEAALTGESEAVLKQTGTLDQAEPPLGDRLNMVYRGTLISNGRGIALVTATGMGTEIGRIATMLQEVKREETPLQKRLGQLGHGLAIAALILVGIIFAQGLLRGGTGAENVKLMFLTSISMAVAAVPEGLPAVVTISLALGAQRMLRRKALIRKLLAVETLGSVTVICSDKTGTLTQNQMSVQALELLGHRVKAEGGQAGQEIKWSEQEAAAQEPQRAVRLLLTAGALCTDAAIASEQDAAGGPKALGDPTETALVVAAEKSGLRKTELQQALPRVDELPFDAERKRMSTVHRVESGSEIVSSLLPDGTELPQYMAFTKGAPDGLLSHCRMVWGDRGPLELSDEQRGKISQANNDLAGQGMRVLGVAYHETDRAEAGPELEENMVFLGLIGLLDPPRPEVRKAVKTCRDAGIRPVIITGDHPLTAAEIARQLGIADGGEALTGADLEQLDEGELRRRVGAATVYARVSPEHKLKIVEALQAEGHVVSMTGDGVNDAPALRRADIGVAMGVTGTDVAKEAAEMVLLDDNFSTIVAAVKEGRAIYDNIRKFIKYLLGTNSGELWTMLLAPLLGLPLPLLPIQILWMNLVTDGLPALALGLEPPEKDIMRRPPRRPDANIFSEGLGWHVLLVGLLMGAVALGCGLWYQSSGRLDLGTDAGVATFRTMVFTIMACLQMGHVLAIRSNRQSLFKQGLLSNPALAGAVLLTLLLQMALLYVPFLQRAFHTVPLSLNDLVVCLALSTTVFWAVEGEKLWLRSRDKRQPPPAKMQAA